jgi:hypothetical protein
MYGGRRYEQEESIYDLIQEEKPAPRQPPRYRSKYPPTAPPSNSTFGRSIATSLMDVNVQGDYSLQTNNHQWRKSHATFGTRESQPDPTNFLKKGTNAPLPDPKPFKYPSGQRKPKVVAKKDIAPVQRRATKNFVTQNALDNIMRVPTKPVQPVDYTKKEDYGKVPSYLNNVKQEIAAEQEYIRQCLEEEDNYYASQMPQMTLMPEDEQARLLAQCKTKWEEVHKAYQTMTHNTQLDTNGKVRRKENFEKQLDALEKDIQKLSKPNVFVVAD